MELTPQILIVVLPLIFLGGFVDSVAGGGGLITLPAYLMAGIPAHLAMGTNKVVNGTGTALASFKYFRGGKVLLRPAVVSGIGALLGAAIGTKIALLINEVMPFFFPFCFVPVYLFLSCLVDFTNVLMLCFVFCFMA